tara:strand:+ start:3305 stop:4861 length:1557 start_codon:yes stop_codon:yes gene_type:complete
MENVVTSVDKLEKKYDRSSYMQQYGGSVISAFIILVSLGLISAYLNIKAAKEPIKKNWEFYKCNPMYIPFAGIIHDDLDYTAQNFSECSNIILSDVALDFTQPLQFLTSNILLIFKGAADGVNALNNELKKIMNNLLNVLRDILNKFAGFIVPLQKLLFKIVDTFKRLTAIVSTSILTVLGINLGFASWIKNLISIFIGVFIASAAIIVVLWFIPFTWIPAGIATVIWTSFFVLFAVIAGWVEHIFKLTKASMPSAPGKPKCFDENTIIKTINGEKKIKDLILNDALNKNDYVNAIFKIINKENKENKEKMYNLNDVIVSGNHFVYHNTLGWIKVEKHPDAIYLSNYNKPYIYCINTTSKRISINNTTFADWDDLDSIDMMKLKNYKIIHNCKHLHSITDSGLNKNMKIKTMNGYKLIQNINLNDVLYNNNEIIGIVKIYANDLKFKQKYSFKNNNIIGSNIYFTNNHLGKYSIENNNDNEKIYYHLITKNGKYFVENIEIYDYNSAIEHILDIKNNY